MQEYGAGLSQATIVLAMMLKPMPIMLQSNTSPPNAKSFVQVLFSEKFQTFHTQA